METVLPPGMKLIKYGDLLSLQVASIGWTNKDYHALLKTFPPEIQERLCGWIKITPRPQS